VYVPLWLITFSSHGNQTDVLRLEGVEFPIVNIRVHLPGAFDKSFFFEVFPVLPEVEGVEDVEAHPFRDHHGVSEGVLTHGVMHVGLSQSQFRVFLGNPSHLDQGDEYALLGVDEGPPDPLLGPREEGEFVFARVVVEQFLHLPDVPGFHHAEVGTPLDVEPFVVEVVRLAKPGVDEAGDVQESVPVRGGAHRVGQLRGGGVDGLFDAPEDGSPGDFFDEEGGETFVPVFLVHAQKVDDDGVDVLAVGVESPRGGGDEPHQLRRRRFPQGVECDVPPLVPLERPPKGGDGVFEVGLVVGEVVFVEEIPQMVLAGGAPKVIRRVGEGGRLLQFL
jgi:hypothetical protein